MHTKYVITLGAPTTAGGEVISADDFKTIEGLPVAVEGDKCWCPQCGTEGVIRAQGPRLSATVGGREIALHDDLCICACIPPPRLIAVQTLKSQAVDGEAFAGALATATQAAASLNASAPSSAPPDADKLPLVLVDPDTSEPVQDRAYRLELAGEIIEGRLDANGCTRPLTAAQRAAVLSWHVQQADA